MAAHGDGGGRSSRPPVAVINLHPLLPPSFTCSPPVSRTCPALSPSSSPSLCLFSTSLPPPPPPSSSDLPSALLRARCVGWCVSVCARAGGLLLRVMEGKKQPGSSPSPPRTTSSSLVADLFGGKNAPSPSSPSFFHSVFPPAATVMGRDSSRSDIYSNSWKHEGQSQTWNAQNVASDGVPQGSGNRERNSAYQHEKIDPCSFSSSLYYGGQDICTNTLSSHNPGYNYKKDGEDDSNNPNAVSRGNWWQGSLYY